MQYATVAAERDVQGPVASYERYEATVAAMRGRQERYRSEMASDVGQAAQNRAHARFLSWLRAEVGLFLLEETGRRRGAIMGLCWTDFDFAACRVTWRPEFDKKRKTWVVPYSPTFFARIREFQRQLGVVGGFVFPRGDDASMSAPPELLSQWIRKAEKDAGLPKLAGGTCHPYRRKWRSERNGAPTKAVMFARGWSDVNTMLNCYDHPEEADILAVTSIERKRRELAPSSISAQTG